MFANLLFTSLLFAAPIPTSGKLPDPIATLTFSPVDVLERDFFRLMQSMPIPNREAAITQMKDHLKSVLGEKGWEGLDLKKPGTGYLIFDEKNPEKSYGFIVFPATDEKKFLDLLARVGKAMDEKNVIESVMGTPGVFKLKGKNDDVPKHVRVHNGYAYIGINAPIDAFAADKLIPADKTIDPKETAKIALTVRASKLPKEWTAKGLQDFEKTAKAGVDHLSGGSESLKVLLKRGVDLIPKYAAAIQSDGDIFGLRVRYDDELAYELFLKAKSGTTLATDIAARKPTMNRYGGLLTDKAVAGFTIKLPFLTQELQDIASKGVAEYYKDLCEKDPPPPEDKRFYDKLVPRIATTINSGEFDLAGALHGPDEKKAYVFSLALSLDDAVGLTPEFKTMVDAKAGGMVDWDKDEADGVKIHTLNAIHLLPNDIKQKLFGNKASCHFALTKTGILFVVGSEALAEIKRAIAVKAAPASILDLKANPVKLAKLVELFAPQESEQIAGMLGKTDKLLSLNSLTITGGEELRITLRSILIINSGGFWAGVR